MNLYLYGIVRWPIGPDSDAPEPGSGAPRAGKAKAGKAKADGRASRSKGNEQKADPHAGVDFGAGVGEPPRPVQFVRYRGLAALVSGIAAEEVGSGQGVRGLRRDMKAHAGVLNAAAALGVTVLPVQFGVILPDPEALITRLLEPQYRSLDRLLTHLRGCVELTFKAKYHEAQALQEVVADSPQLARAAASLRGRPASYQSKIDLGKRVAEELQARRDQDARWLLNALAPVVRDANVKAPGNELTVLNASFLVPRQEMERFDAALADVAEATRQRMALDCVGPLPPYSFVDLRIA